MEKYLEQTESFPNFQRDRRKPGRWSNESFVPGTRWVLDDATGMLSGEGMRIHDPQAKAIRAICKEVEPGFGAIVNKFDFKMVIGRLIDDGKLTVADLQNALDDDIDGFDESDDADDKERLKQFYRHRLNQLMFDYRHWLSLEPPSNDLVEAVAKDECKDAITR